MTERDLMCQIPGCDPWSVAQLIVKDKVTKVSIRICNKHLNDFDKVRCNIVNICSIESCYRASIAQASVLNNVLNLCEYHHDIWVNDEETLPDSKKCTHVYRLNKPSCLNCQHESDIFETKDEEWLPIV